MIFQQICIAVTRCLTIVFSVMEHFYFSFSIMAMMIEIIIRRMKIIKIIAVIMMNKCFLSRIMCT